MTNLHGGIISRNISGIEPIMAAKRKTSRESVRAYRQRMRRNGFRQVNLWVPDTRAPGFIKECRRQSRLASVSKESEVDEFLLGAVGAVEGWT
jgi:hypothetical protein